MAEINLASLGEKLAEIFANGTGEAGLEIGADPGLDRREYIRIPRSMVKRVAVRLTAEAWEAYLNAAHEHATPAAGLPARGTAVATRGADEDFFSMVGRPGWFDPHRVVISEGHMTAELVEDGGLFSIDLVRVAPPTIDDVKAFYAVNVGHVRDDEFDERTTKWIHATRFWTVVAGLVTADRADEYVIVDNPAALPGNADEVAEFIVNYSTNAWTAASARAASWRKTNHATGGDIAAGYPRRWLQKMGYITSSPDAAAEARAHKLATSAFYVATHAVSVHAALALMVPEDDNHWASIDPHHGLVTEWEIGNSAKIRMRPNTQVAGVAIVADAMVVLKMCIKDSIAPLISAIDQAPALVAAYQQVERDGMRLRTGAKWFLEGHPAHVEPVAFDQKDPAFADLAGELAAIGTKYYASSTIAQSASLRNAARTLGDEVAKQQWAQVAAMRRQVSQGQLIDAIKVLKGAGSTDLLTDFLSHDAEAAARGATAYNTVTTRLANMVGLARYPIIDAAVHSKIQSSSAPALSAGSAGGAAGASA